MPTRLKDVGEVSQSVSRPSALPLSVLRPRPAPAPAGSARAATPRAGTRHPSVRRRQPWRVACGRGAVARSFTVACRHRPRGCDGSRVGRDLPFLSARHGCLASRGRCRVLMLALVICCILQKIRNSTAFACLCQLGSQGPLSLQLLYCRVYTLANMEHGRTRQSRSVVGLNRGASSAIQSPYQFRPEGSARPMLIVWLLVRSQATDTATKLLVRLELVAYVVATGRA